MKPYIVKKHTTILASLIIAFSIITGCKSAAISDYSSVADREQKISLVRTEMLIIKGDDEKIDRDYSVISAVDYLTDGKKIYYLIIAPGSSGGPKPKLSDLMLKSDYPYIILGQNVSDFISGLEKCAAEWDSADMKNSGAVYNLFISSPQNFSPWLEAKTRWYEEKKYFEIFPYIKFNYTKTEGGAKAKLALGSRLEQVVYAVVDGRTVKNKVFVSDEEKVWTFDSSAGIKDFQNLLSKGLSDLRDKGMGGYTKKTESSVDVKKDIITDVKKAEEPKPKKKKQRKK